MLRLIRLSDREKQRLFSIISTFASQRRISIFNELLAALVRVAVGAAAVEVAFELVQAVVVVVFLVGYGA